MPKMDEEARRLHAQGLKRCPACKLVKERKEFARNQRRWDDCQVHCKACEAERRNRYRKPWYDAVAQLIAAHQDEFDRLMAEASVENDWESAGGRVRVWP